MAQLWQVTVSTNGDDYFVENLHERFRPRLWSSDDGILLNGVDDPEGNVLEAHLVLPAETPDIARSRALEWFENACVSMGLELEAEGLEPHPATAEAEAMYVVVRIIDAARAEGETIDVFAAKAGLSDEEKKEIHASSDLPLSLVFRLAEVLNVTVAELVDPDGVETAFRDGERTERLNAERQKDPTWTQQQLKARLQRKQADAAAEA